MKILIYGAGAVGGYFAVKLAQAGHDITLIARRKRTEAIQQFGLTLVENHERKTIQPALANSVAHLFRQNAPQFDLVIMTMKSYDFAEALNALIAFYPDLPAIMTVQNGLGVEKPLIDHFGAEKVIAGTLTAPISKESVSAFVVNQEGRGLALASAQAGRGISGVVKLFQKAGITAVSLPDYRAMKWSKTLLNSMGNATCAIINRGPSVIYKSSSLFNLELKMQREILAVMRKLNLDPVDLPGAPTKKLVRGLRNAPNFILKPMLTKIVTDGRGTKMPSFQIDLLAGKEKSEVEFHNGAVARIGRKYGVATPVNSALNDILMQLARKEVDWEQYNGNAKLLLSQIKKRQ